MQVTTVGPRRWIRIDARVGPTFSADDAGVGWSPDPQLPAVSRTACGRCRRRRPSPPRLPLARCTVPRSSGLDEVRAQVALHSDLHAYLIDPTEVSMTARNGREFI
jgi:hypothetical protein